MARCSFGRLVLVDGGTSIVSGVEGEWGGIRSSCCGVAGRGGTGADGGAAEARVVIATLCSFEGSSVVDTTLSFVPVSTVASW